MNLLLHGIVAEAAPLTVEPELQLIKAAGLAGIVKTVAPELSRESAAVLAYGERVMLVHRQTTLIPMRYGNILADEVAVMRHLQVHEVRYRTQLNELKGCEEMGIRLSLDLATETTDEATGKAPQSGLDYLLGRKRAYTVPESAERQAAQLNKALAGLYRQHRATLDVFNGQRTYLLSYLVPRASLPAFLGQLATLGDGPTDIGSISGPWPPYSFAN